MLVLRRIGNGFKTARRGCFVNLSIAPQASSRVVQSSGTQHLDRLAKEMSRLVKLGQVGGDPVKFLGKKMRMAVTEDGRTLKADLGDKSPEIDVETLCKKEKMICRTLESHFTGIDPEQSTNRIASLQRAQASKMHLELFDVPIPVAEAREPSTEG